MLKQIRTVFFTALCLAILLNTVNDTDSSLTDNNNSNLNPILLIGTASLDISANSLILNAAMHYIISTNRFDESLF